MSIIDFEQTGEWLKKNQADIAITVGFILVALIAFGAGRLSVSQPDDGSIVVEENKITPISLTANVSQPLIQAMGEPVGVAGQNESVKGVFIASRSGTKYHWPWCSYAQKIKSENQVWFNTEKEAQTAGYSPCGCIQNKAPAGLPK